MRKPAQFEAAYGALAKIAAGPITGDAAAELRCALSGPNSLLAAKAAEIAGKKNLVDIIPDMVAAFDRFMVNGARTDKQCNAKAAITGALNKLEHWDDAVEQWILRVNFLVAFRPDLALPEIGEAERKLLIEQICLGAYSQKDLRAKSVLPVVKAWLNGAQQALVEKFAPERYELPTGHRARITYGLDGPPKLAAKIQDLYDVQGTPAVAGGRVPLVVQILAPNQRPVQVTQDLAAFWRDHYPRVKQEMQRKYPKHKWR